MDADGLSLLKSEGGADSLRQDLSLVVALHVGEELLQGVLLFVLVHRLFHWEIVRYK